MNCITRAYMSNGLNDMEAENKMNLVFAVNGERFKLRFVDPSTTLLEFLRTQTRYKGAKLGCGEGGCGACVVLLSKFDPLSKQVEEFTVSSCLTLLCSIHLCSVTTTEGLGNSKNGFHSIHQRFSGFHASQCGFCTPGMCMSLFSAIINADKTERPEPPVGFSKLTVSEAEKAIAGNICRCTGYRPIVDTCKSFAADVDMEDLGLNSFWRKGDIDANVDKLPFYSRNCIETFPDFLKAEVQASLDSLSSLQLENHASSRIGEMDISDISQGTGLNVSCWYHPNSIDELVTLLKSCDKGQEVKLVVGNTSSGVYKELGQYDKYIDLRGIPELSMIRRDSLGIEIGAAVTISRAIEVLMEENEDKFLSNERTVFSKIANHLSKVASQFVRNTASLGGNLIMAQRYQFASDIATVLLAAGASLLVQMDSEKLVLTLEEFLEKPPLDFGFLLLSIRIPNWNHVMSPSSDVDDSVERKPTTKTKLLFETYRAAPRPLGNAVAYVNAAFLAQISSRKKSEYLVENVRLVFGAYGTEHAIRARRVEKFLEGKCITVSVMLEAIGLLRSAIVPKEGTPNPVYRSSLAVGFLFDFLRPLSIELVEPLKVSHIDLPDTNARIELQTENVGVSSIQYSHGKSLGQIDHLPSLLSSTQTIKFSREYLPVGEPTKKAGAEIQASGEAVYVDDIPSPRDCLYGAFIYSTKPMAHVKGIEFRSTLAPKKIVAVITVQDIPSGGKNVGSGSIFGEDPLFADSVTQCAGQPVGVVIAATQRLANMAAGQAVVEYDTENIESPILSVDDAVKRSSFFDVPPFVSPKQVGDFSKGMERADHKIISAEVNLPSQYHFYMETQTSLAIPDEDNCFVVYSSSQTPMVAQKTIAKCLGIPYHNVRVITRRVGGGFGGKAMRSLPVSTACALAAYKLQRPVRMYLDRKTDMVVTGGRHPMKINYSVGFKSDGKITALHLDILINAGITEDVSPILPHNIIGALKKYDWGALSFDIKVCKTNLTTKTAMRGPGEVQGSYIAEAVIEHVASTLAMGSGSLRKMNLHTFESLQLFYEGNAGEPTEFTLPYVFDKLASTTDFQLQVENFRQFNSCNRWKKRGISCVPIIHPVVLRPTPAKVGILDDGSIVVEVGGIELGQGIWTKVKLMTAFAFDQLWRDGSQNLLDRIRVVQADTLSLIQGGYTAGSTTSESSCEAVRLACNVLVERLVPVMERIQETMSSVSWDALILQANWLSVNLSASSYFVPDHSSSGYLNYGAAISKVEIDLLTGATMILGSDLIYDCGQSLNPAVDLGQIEGAFVQGIGFFMHEDHLTNADGLVISDGTWTYKVPTVDTIPKQFNVEILNSGHHQKRVLSSKASGEPPLLLAASVHCATREAIREARKELFSYGGYEGSPLTFQLPVPATMPVVKELCGFDNVEKYLETLLHVEGMVKSSCILCGSALVIDSCCNLLNQ